MRLLSHGATDRGRNRANNEDACLVDNSLGLFAVADGVGGLARGEVASNLAVETLREAVPDMLGSGDRTPPAETAAGADPVASALRYAVTLANRRILEAAEDTPARAGMGTTLTALLFSGRRAVIAHIGDSRAYRLRHTAFQQLTEDHSAVAEQVKAGVLTPAQARTSAHRHVITRALGLDESGFPDISSHEVKTGDVYLLCTDGLTEMVENDGIRKILASPSPATAAKMLVDAANRAGGVDNITAVVVRVIEV
ncbi:MAG: Stp1/IreP family PP2C-type Ser/Thr phosphatase [Nitrospirota bacterium]|nr:Stp1/IreP family PP2C-type Ser/Thr phosphatase [Nitrospirota bacterium]